MDWIKRYFCSRRKILSVTLQSWTVIAAWHLQAQIFPEAAGKAADLAMHVRTPAAHTCCLVHTSQYYAFLVSPTARYLLLMGLASEGKGRRQSTCKRQDSLTVPPRLAGARAHLILLPQFPE